MSDIIESLTEELEEANDLIKEQKSEIDSLQDDISELEDEIKELEETISELEEVEIPDLTALLDKEKYELFIEKFNLFTLEQLENFF